MATAKTLNRGRALLLALPLGLTACTGVITLSGEGPYSDMIGQCYVLQQPMYVRDNVCWELGGLILSPDESAACLRDVVLDINQGAQIIILDVRRQHFGSFGFCPQILVSIDEVSIFNKEIYVPLCLSREYMSWLQDPLWQRGDAIRLKKE